MQAKLKPVWILIRRELRDQLRDWRIIVPIIVLTVVFPWILNFTAQQFAAFLQSYQAELISDRIIPLLMMMVGFFPLTVSLVIALEVFVGEKERRSIEPLLSSPLEDWQMFLGKMIAAMILPVLASYLGTAVYLVGLNHSIGYVPETVLLVQVLGLTTVQALVMVSGAVVVSSQVTSVRAANLLASFIVVPMALVVQGEALAMFWARHDILWWAMLGMVLIAIQLIRMGLAYFNREELLGRELDSINLRWGWKVFWKAFRGDSPTLRGWLTHEIPDTLRRLALPMALTALLLVGITLAGASQAPRFQLPEQVMDPTLLRERFSEGMQSLPFFTVGSIPIVWLHNLRAVAIATFLGFFSFGVGGLLVIMLPLLIIGYFAGAASLSGFSPWLFLGAFIVPHGILEIPALIIAGAAILRLGATLTTYSRGRTIGEAWLSALADWARVMLVLVIPMLLGAAAIEVLITPRIAIMLLGG